MNVWNEKCVAPTENIDVFFLFHVPAINEMKTTKKRRPFINIGWKTTNRLGRQQHLIYEGNSGTEKEN